jgi:hypothetical protein
MRLIGMNQNDAACKVCSLLQENIPALNSVTLDLLLGRRTIAEMVSIYDSVVAKTGSHLTPFNLNSHKRHCHSESVPLVYSVNPSAFELKSEEPGPTRPRLHQVSPLEGLFLDWVLGERLENLKALKTIRDGVRTEFEGLLSRGARTEADKSRMETLSQELAERTNEIDRIDASLQDLGLQIARNNAVTDLPSFFGGPVARRGY